MRERVKVADGRAVLDPADLGLGEAEPAAEEFLGDAVPAVACRGSGCRRYARATWPMCWAAIASRNAGVSQNAAVTGGGPALR